MFESDWSAGVPTIQITKQTDHHSGKMTQIYMDIELAGVDPSTVNHIQVLSTFKYSLRDILRLDMVGMMQAAVETPGGAGIVKLDGELNFQQDEAILIDNVRRVLFDTDPLLADYSTFGLNEIVENYQYRKGKLLGLD